MSLNVKYETLFAVSINFIKNTTWGTIQHCDWVMTHTILGNNSPSEFGIYLIGKSCVMIMNGGSLHTFKA